MARSGAEGLEYVGRQAGPWIRQATAFPHSGHLKRSLPLWFTTDHGGRSIGTWLISHDRLARSAEKEGEVVLAADREQHSRLDLDGTGTATDMAGVPDLDAAKSGRGETTVAKMLSSRVN